MTISIAELNDGLGGEVLCAQDAMNKLVEYFVLGAMGVDSALKYSRQKANQAVLTGGDRAEIQLLKNEVF